MEAEIIKSDMILTTTQQASKYETRHMQYDTVAMVILDNSAFCFYPNKARTR
jgi:hypothetical protein